MPWYPSAKACPAAIKPTVQCFFPTLYRVLLFNFSSFGEKLFFCLRGYRRAIARSAVQKQPERRARMFLCSSAAEQAANGWRYQPCTTTNRLCRAIARSAVQKQPERRARMFLCSSAAEQAANGWRYQPCTTTNRLCRAIARSAVQKQPERRALRPQARFGAQPPQAALGAEIGCSSVHPPPNRRRMGEGDNLALLLGGAANPAPPPTSYRHAAQRWHLT